MLRSIGIVLAGGLMVVGIAGCSATSKPASASGTTAAATGTSVAASPAASGDPTSRRGGTGPRASGDPGIQPERVSGTVQTADGGKITLADGTSFTVADNARVFRQQTIAAADLKSGQFVAVTAKRQQDNTLLASIVSIFSDSLSKTIQGGQRPLPQGNLMTNATIDQVSGNSFTVTFTGGGANITLAPDAQILKQSDATTADIKPGAKVSAGVVNGTAQMVLIQ